MLNDARDAEGEHPSAGADDLLAASVAGSGALPACVASRL
jgi:hypothetical protein